MRAFTKDPATHPLIAQVISQAGFFDLQLSITTAFVLVAGLFPRREIIDTGATSFPFFMSAFVFVLVCRFGIHFTLRTLEARGTTLANYLSATRLRNMLGSLMLALAVTFTFTISDWSLALSQLVVAYLPYARHLGAELTAKIVDWIIGGLVFEVARRIYSRSQRSLTKSFFRKQLS